MLSKAPLPFGMKQSDCFYIDNQTIDDASEESSLFFNGTSNNETSLPLSEHGKIDYLQRRLDQTESPNMYCYDENNSCKNDSYDNYVPCSSFSSSVVGFSDVLNCLSSTSIVDHCDINLLRKIVFQECTHRFSHSVSNCNDFQARKKTLVLDLDETLVHSFLEEPSIYDFSFHVCINGISTVVFTLVRPGAREFIRKLSDYYEIFVYTASHCSYADLLLDRLDTDRFISHRLFRDSCIYSDTDIVKDLSVLQRNLSDIVFVDNLATSYKFQPKNGIQCSTFIDDMNDDELFRLIPFLKYLSTKSDVRLYTNIWRHTSSMHSLN